MGVSSSGDIMGHRLAGLVELWQMIGGEFFIAEWAHNGPFCTVSSQRGTEDGGCLQCPAGRTQGDRQAERMGATEGGLGRGSSVLK